MVPLMPVWSLHMYDLMVPPLPYMEQVLYGSPTCTMIFSGQLRKSPLRFLTNRIAYDPDVPRCDQHALKLCGRSYVIPTRIPEFKQKNTHLFLGRRYSLRRNPELMLVEN